MCDLSRQSVKHLAADLFSAPRACAAPLTVEGIRQQLADDFEPRYQRALSRFGPTLSRKQVAGVTCLIIDPPVASPAVTILYLFGGGYVSGCPEFEMPVAAHLSVACNARIILPYYALAPEHPYPAALHQVQAVYEAISATHPGGIVLAGESAGGGLSLCLAAELAKREASLPLALCLFSPWLDLTDQALFASADVDDPSMTVDFLDLCARSYCTQAERCRVSPANGVIRFALPPTYISTGSRDIMRPVLEDFAARCEVDKQPVELILWSEMWHAFELYDELEEAPIALDRAAQFIRKATGCEPT